MTLLTIIKYACFANCVPLYTRGVYLRYDDLQDAAEGKDILEQHGFQVVYVTGYQYALAKAQDTAQLNEFEGQMSLTVLIDANPEHAIWEFSEGDYALMQLAVQNVCSAFGRVRNLVHVSTDNEKMSLTFRVEFSSVDSAGRAVQSLAMDPVWGTNLAVSHPPSPCLALWLTLLQKSFQWVTAVALPWTGKRAANSPHRHKPRVDDQGRFVGYRPALNPVSPTAFWRHPADQHNRVRRERILDGSDVRTTIMLRNIPNKMDWVCHSFSFSSNFTNPCGSWPSRLSSMSSASVPTISCTFASTSSRVVT
jgi:hypothetical protein